MSMHFSNYSKHTYIVIKHYEEECAVEMRANVKIATFYVIYLYIFAFI